MCGLTLLQPARCGRRLDASFCQNQCRRSKNEGLSQEDRSWEKKDPKTGKVTSWGYEGDWKPLNPKKEGSGKAANNAGKALQKTKQLAKEDTGLDTPVPKKPKTTDTLSGRVKVPKTFHNQHVDSKVELASEESKHEDEAEDKKLISKMIKKDDKIEDAKDTKKDIKLIKKYMKKEDVETLTEIDHLCEIGRAHV